MRKFYQRKKKDKCKANDNSVLPNTSTKNVHIMHLTRGGQRKERVMASPMVFGETTRISWIKHAGINN